MNYFQSFDGEKIAYFIHQNPPEAKKTIILIHGFGGDTHLIKNFVNALCENDDHKIISYMLRGHANSSRNFPNNFAYIEETHSHDLQALLQHLKVENPIFIGHSLGGIILQSYINQKLKPQPQQTIFICTTTKMFGLDYFRKYLYQLITLFPNSETNFKKQNQEFYEKFKNSWDLDITRFYYDTQVVGGFINWMLYFFSLHGWENHHLNLIDKANNYYIYGKRDIIVPKLLQEQRLEDLNKINKIEINSGHIPVITQPKELAKKINEIINK